MREGRGRELCLKELISKTLALRAPDKAERENSSIKSAQSDCGQERQPCVKRERLSIAHLLHALCTCVPPPVPGFTLQRPQRDSCCQPQKAARLTSAKGELREGCQVAQRLTRVTEQFGSDKGQEPGRLGSRKNDSRAGLLARPLRDTRDQGDMDSEHPGTSFIS